MKTAPRPLDRREVAAARALDELALGPIDQTLLGWIGRERAVLASGPGGPLLVAPRRPPLWLARRLDVRFAPGRLWDELRVGDLVLRLDARRRGDALRILAAGGARAPRDDLGPGLEPVEAAWLGARLAAGERVLTAAPRGDRRPVPAPWEPAATARRLHVVTTRATFDAAVGRFGDAWVDPLADESLELGWLAPALGAAPLDRALWAHAAGAPGALGLRARQISELLAPGGLTGADARAAPARGLPATLSDSQLGALRAGPDGPAGASLWERASGLVAQRRVPPGQLLEDFCEPIAAAAHPDLARALAVARALLGLPEVRAFVSRGRRAVGVVGHDQGGPVLLLGAEHLGTSSDHALAPSEALFVVVSELARLRLGGEPLTRADLVDGALARSGETLDLAFGVLPLLRGVQWAERAARVAGAVPLGAVRRVGGLAAGLRGRLTRRPHDPEHLAPRDEHLLGAQLRLQAAGDRAGLLATQDPAAAIRGLLRTRREWVRVLQRAEREGLGEALSSRRDAGHSDGRALLARVESLLRFAAAPMYDALHAAAWGD